MERTYLIRTFGCQMNEHDSERIAGLLTADGMTPTDDVANAGVVVFNTCAIRENADNRLYGNLGHLKPLKDKDPSLRIVVAGCLAQKDQGEIQRRAPWVDIVVGTHALPHLLDLLATSERDGPQMDVREYTEVFPSALPSARHDPFRAWVSIAPGCDNACTFCIVPLVRGPQRSRAIGDILAEVQGLARSGVVEVTLLGQNVNTYGRDVTVPGSSNRPLFGELLRQVGAVEGIRRVRFTSPHPHDFTPDVIEAMAETPDRLRAHPLPVAVRLRPGPEGDAALVPARSLPRMAGRDPRPRSPTSPCRRTSSSGSPARPRRTSPTRSISSSGLGSTARTRSSTRRDRARGPRRSTTRSRRRSCRSASTGWSSCSSASRSNVRSRRSVPRSRCWWKGRASGVRPRRPGPGPTGSCTSPPPLEAGTFVHARITEASAHHLAGELVPAPEAVAV